MPQRIIVGPDNSIRVVEVGPRGIRGPRGLPGSDSDSHARHGLILGTPPSPPEVTIDSVTYQVFDFSTTLPVAQDVGVVINPDLSHKLLVKFPPACDVAVDSKFSIHFVMSNPMVHDWEIYQSNGGAPIRIPTFFVWANSDIVGSISLEATPIPAVFTGGEDDVWGFGQNAPRMARAGCVDIPSTDSTEDGVDLDLDLSGVGCFRSYITTSGGAGKAVMKIGVTAVLIEPFVIEVASSELTTLIFQAMTIDGTPLGPPQTVAIPSEATVDGTTVVKVYQRAFFPDPFLVRPA